VPGLFILGAVPDGFKMLDNVDKEYWPGRALDRPWTLALQAGAAHDYNNANALVLPFLDTLIRGRREPWLGDPATGEIAAAKDYRGEKAQAVWLPNRYVAHCWRSFIVKDAAVRLAAEGLPEKGKRTVIVKAGATIQLKATADAQFYDGDEEIPATWKPTRLGPHCVYARYAADKLTTPGLFVVKQ
jgi:hypothetical protein